MSDSQIQALFLDLGGVMLTNGWDSDTRRAAAEQFGLNLAEMDSRHRMTFDTYEIGKLTLGEYLRRAVFYQPRPFTPEQFTAWILDQSKEYPGMLEMVRALKAKYRLKVFVVSNEGRELTEYRIKKFALDEFVDAFVASCFVHLRKPDNDIYRMALDLAQVPAGHVAYLEDRPLFVEVAAQFGIQSIQHTSFESTRSALAGLGLTF
ncbi:MAG: HAD hydrolase-like protein [Acidobacteriota bacterium]|nr:HAD hydrolase-like protein [Acidobacteriota bacterium]